MGEILPRAPIPGLLADADIANADKKVLWLAGREDRGLFCLLARVKGELKMKGEGHWSFTH